jgi:hypothetical protein
VLAGCPERKGFETDMALREHRNQTKPGEHSIVYCILPKMVRKSSTGRFDVRPPSMIVRRCGKSTDVARLLSFTSFTIDPNRVRVRCKSENRRCTVKSWTGHTVPIRELQGVQHLAASHPLTQPLGHHCLPRRASTRVHVGSTCSSCSVSISNLIFGRTSC